MLVPKELLRLVRKIRQYAIVVSDDEDGSATQMFGCCLLGLVGAVHEAQTRGDLGVLRSLMQTIADWCRDRETLDGKRIGDLVDKLLARRDGTLN